MMVMNLHRIFMHFPAHTTAKIFASVVAMTCAAYAQNALDGSLHIGSGGVNSAPANSSSIAPPRRNTSGLRQLSDALGYSSERDLARDIGVSNVRRLDPTLTRGYVPPTGTTKPTSTIDWKKNNPLKYDSQGLALSTNTSRSWDQEAIPAGNFQIRNGERGVFTASSLRGVQREFDRDRIGGGGLSQYETARLREDIRNNTIRADAIGVGLRDPFKAYQPTDAIMPTKVAELKARSNSQNLEPSDTRISGYQAVMKEVKQRFESRLNEDEKIAETEGNQKQPSAQKDSDERVLSAYEKLKKEIGDKQQEIDAQISADPKSGASSSTANPADQSTTAVDAKDQKRTGVNMTLDEYALVLKHGQRIDSMTGPEKNRLNELLSEGQRAMYEGNSFVAEKRFEVALAIHPDDPLALAGLLHCQISANLPNSAAISLKKLFTQHPEMMDVKWGPQAVPPRPRLEKSLLEATHRIAIGRDVPQYGLLQAYIGHLLSDQDAVTAGLFAMRGDVSDENMAAILRKLWVDPATDKFPQRIIPADPSPKP